MAEFKSEELKREIQVLADDFERTMEIKKQYFSNLMI